MHNSSPPVSPGVLLPFLACPEPAEGLVQEKEAKERHPSSPAVDQVPSLRRFESGSHYRYLNAGLKSTRSAVLHIRQL